MCSIVLMVQQNIKRKDPAGVGEITITQQMINELLVSVCGLFRSVKRIICICVMLFVSIIYNNARDSSRFYLNLR